MKHIYVILGLILLIVLAMPSVDAQYNNQTGRAHGMIIASASLDFPLSASTACDELTMTATGAVIGDVILLGVPNGAMNTNSDFSAFVSATNTVTVKHCAHGVAVNPSSGTFKVVVFKE